MAQNVIINGVTYPSVPRVEIPLSGSSGKAVFYDTSDATAAAGNILSGKTAYVGSGKITGSIATKSSSDLTVSGATVTAPAGYYASAASKSVASGAITASGSGSGTVDSLSFAWDTPVGHENGTFVATGSASVSGTATASVSTAGYVASGVTGTGSVTGTAHVNAVVPTIQGSIACDGTKTVKPVISRTSTSATGATNVGTGDASTTAPSSGCYVSVQSAAKTNTLTPGVAITTAGYGNNQHKGISGNNFSVGASASDVTYITVPTGSASTPATTITSNPSISISSGGKITASVSKTQSITPNVTAGYVSSGTAGTITVSGTAEQQMTVQAAQTITPTTTDQTIAAGTYLTGAQTIKGDANLQAAYIASGVSIFGVAGTLSSPVISQDGTTKVLSIS